ncbi:PHD finger protein 20-like isoform X2 [Myxocyprinus asiaticus]|uniref:PHD finger protein 20-like isoform X2 n=1 Tax=Myxocyprinus asiaticus TaxID=70543 RepID=UPI002222FA0C|nr:PHD finger protein 20-like isoform X2 [Myxocyprinus asiaticus]
MTKTPPHRRGITFEVGAQLEARDSLKNWYAASIEKIDYEDEKVLIHYRQWSHRYDEWFNWSSPYLRPVERIQLRKQGLSERQTAPGFYVNQKVLASWSDCRYYPAKILSRDKDGFYTVKFFDGVVKTVKGIKVKPFHKESSDGKNNQRARKRGDQNGKEWKPKENGNSRSNGSRHSTSDQDGESESEGDEEDSMVIFESRKLQNGRVRESTANEKVNESGPDSAEQKEKPPSDEIKTELFENEKGENKTEKKDNKTEKKEMNGGQKEEKPKALQNGVDKSEGGKKEEQASDDSPSLPRRTRSRMADEKDVERPIGPELRKRRASTGQTPPSKRSRANSSTDRNSRSQIKPAKSDSVPETFENKDGPTCPAGNAAPTEEAESRPELALKQQVHLPTSNKYSREPLYRVIKNQPPPILSIELDHNPFKCKITDCLKSFRKASLLHYHMKYYHAQSDPCPPRCVHTRSPDKQNHSQETPRRRRTVSASQHTLSPLSDSKPGHTLSPPAAGSMHRQRSNTLGAERSKENQHINRSLHDDRDWVAKETGIKERESLREKRQRDFFRIKLKKKKKKKKSKSEYYSTEESIGLKSVPCNLNSAFKLPLSLTHRSYTGHCPKMMLSQGEDSSSDLSSDSPIWSEDESDPELDLNMPLSEQGVDKVTHGSEIIRCICEVQEENDFMIQCDECLCWQHGTCMGLYEDSVPDTYSCYICRDPPAQRQSQRYWYDKDWLSSGHMYGLSFLEENYSHQNSKKVTAAHQLLGDVQRVFEVLNGLQLKMSILQTQAHPDLKLWRQPWKHTDGLRRKTAGDSGIATPFPSSPLEFGVNEFETLKSEVPSPIEMHCSFQDSYISSEHCYQKPRTYYPAVERRLVVETRGGSELEDSLRSTEDLLEMAEQRYGMPLDHEQHKLLADCTFSKELESRMKLLVSTEQEKSCAVNLKEEEPDPVTPDPVTPDPKPDPDLLLHQQWQLNLLEHIEAVQDEVTHRMDLIERELDGEGLPCDAESRFSEGVVDPSPASLEYFVLHWLLFFSLPKFFIANGLGPVNP